jgi:hypothetical protein
MRWNALLTLHHVDGSMAKRNTVEPDLGDDLLVRLRDLHKQAIVERSHYYVGRCVSDAFNEITALRNRLGIPT